VIDVKGRQCSDLLAFHWGKLQDGSERGLDSTTTHSLMGNAYPQPGLYGKFYDQDQEPLVEVVRDTVGRHDTFGLACYAKYYEDIGYFGHVNCTDNFNAQLLPSSIAHRVTPDAEPKLTKDTGFRPRTGDLTGRFTDYNGYWLPTAYDNHGAVDEYWACRERAAIMDLSPLRKWEVLGPDAEELLQTT